jgi:hypothetical protein
MNEEGNQLTFKELAKLYEIYRDYAKHEDRLLNERFTRFLASQSILFAAYGALALEKIKSFVAEPNHEIIDVIPAIKSFFANFIGLNFILHINMALVVICIVCIFGLATTYISLVSMNAARRAIDQIDIKWQVDVLGKLGATHRLFPNMTGGGDDYAHKQGWKLVYLLPRLATLVWLLLIALHVAFVK